MNSSSNNYQDGFRAGFLGLDSQPSAERPHIYELGYISGAWERMTQKREAQECLAQSKSETNSAA